jgi:hypothetical protein
MTDVRLSEALIARIKARAGDPARRSDDASLAANSVPMEDLLAGLPPIEDPAMRAHVDRAQGMLSRVMGMLGGGGGGFAAIGPGLGFSGGVMSFGGKVEVKPAPPPCAEARIAAAEAVLGFALPPALRQVYVEVADGGFGPGDGLYGLDALLAKWRELTHEPVGPQGQEWPRNLLPIAGEDWDLICLDRAGGRLIFWDVDEMADFEHEQESGDEAWNRAVKPEADSLEAWLERWLGGRTQAEQILDPDRGNT